MNAAQKTPNHTTTQRYTTYLVFSVETDRFLIADKPINVDPPYSRATIGWPDDEVSKKEKTTFKAIPQRVVDATGLPDESVIDVFSCFSEGPCSGNHMLHIIAVKDEFTPAPASGYDTVRWTKSKRFTKSFHDAYWGLLMMVYHRELRRTEELIARLEAGGENDD